MASKELCLKMMVKNKFNNLRSRISLICEKLLYECIIGIRGHK